MDSRIFEFVLDFEKDSFKIISEGIEVATNKYSIKGESFVPYCMLYSRNDSATFLK